MSIINTSISGGGQQPSGTITITSNTTTNVAQYEYAVTAVPTTAPALYREFQLGSDGTLKSNTTTTYIMDFTGVKRVGAYCFARAYDGNRNISGTVDMSDMVELIDSYACINMFSGCTGLTSVDLSSLTRINNDYSGANMFYDCTGVTSINLSSLTTIRGDCACQSMFGNCTRITSANLPALTEISGGNTCNSMFSSCAGLTSFDLSALTTISGYCACSSMFSNCTGITSANLPALTEISGDNTCQYMFQGCTSLTTVYIGGASAITFGEEPFYDIFSGCTQNIDVYAPAANQAEIEAMDGYPNFGGEGAVTWHWRS